MARSRQTYAQRVTSKIPATLREHPGWTEEEARRYLRGHGAPGEGITPEHGGAGRQREVGRQTGRRRVRMGEGREVTTTYRDRVAIAQINGAARDGEKSGDMPRVQVNAHTRSQGWQVIGENRGRAKQGYSASYLADKVAKHNGSLRAALADLVANPDNPSPTEFGDYETADAYAEAVDDWQIVVNE